MTTNGDAALESRANEFREQFTRIRKEIERVIVGQEQVVEQVLIALFAGGHCLLEGVPGLGKTLLVRTLSDVLDLEFRRIQFTPDLMPADIIGTTMVFEDESGRRQFEFQKGPIFGQMLLADEINRAPAKVQSALLEAMAERQVTVGGVTRPLPPMFMVMATQNPIEQEGTYPLPEAQLDRFLMHVVIDYPAAEAEQLILRLARGEALQQSTGSDVKLSQDDVFAARKEVLNLHMSDAVEQYLVQLIMATRRAEGYGKDLDSWIEFGASPRGTIALDRCARAHAWLKGRDYVSPEDVQAVAHDVLRHRLLLSFEAEASGMTVNKVINELLQRVPVI